MATFCFSLLFPRLFFSFFLFFSFPSLLSSPFSSSCFPPSLSVSLYISGLSSLARFLFLCCSFCLSSLLASCTPSPWVCTPQSFPPAWPSICPPPIPHFLGWGVGREKQKKKKKTRHLHPGLLQGPSPGIIGVLGVTFAPSNLREKVAIRSPLASGPVFLGEALPVLCSSSRGL